MDTKTQKTPKDYFLKVLFPSFALLIGIALLADLWVTESIIPKAETSPAGRVYRLINHKYENNQIPVFGSSRARCSYNPKFMGINAYNYGVDGVSLIGTLSFARIHCENSPNIPVIINLDYWFWKTVGDVSTYVPFAGNKHIAYTLDSGKLNSWQYRIYGIRYFDIYSEYFRHSFKALFPSSDSLYNGYDYEMGKPVPTLAALNSSIELRKENPFEFKPEPSQVQLLEKLMKDFPQTTFFFIKAPYHHSFLEDAKSMEGYSNYIDQIKTHKNAIVIDDVNDMAYSDSCFSNNIHVNRKGAKQFGLWLNERLKTFPQLKDYQTQ